MRKCIFVANAIREHWIYIVHLWTWKRIPYPYSYFVHIHNTGTMTIFFYIFFILELILFCRRKINGIPVIEYRSTQDVNNRWLWQYGIWSYFPPWILILFQSSRDPTFIFQNAEYSVYVIRAMKGVCLYDIIRAQSYICSIYTTWIYNNNNNNNNKLVMYTWSILLAILALLGCYAISILI
jgi:hypothetical protein